MANPNPPELKKAWTGSELLGAQNTFSNTTAGRKVLIAIKTCNLFFSTDNPTNTGIMQSEFSSISFRLYPPRHRLVASLHLLFFYYIFYGYLYLFSLFILSVIFSTTSQVTVLIDA
jgi:hypothetical protein